MEVIRIWRYYELFSLKSLVQIDPFIDDGTI